MERVLNRSLNALPAGFSSWEEAKDLFFRVLHYEVHTEEAARFHVCARTIPRTKAVVTGHPETIFKNAA